MGAAHGVEDGWSGASWLRRKWSGRWMLGVSSHVVIGHWPGDGKGMMKGGGMYWKGGVKAPGS